MLIPEGTQQRMLKSVLLGAPSSSSHRTSSSAPEPRGDDGEGTSRSRRGPVPSQTELSASHVLKERRRREKLNEGFTMLRSLVPFVTKVRVRLNARQTRVTVTAAYMLQQGSKQLFCFVSPIRTADGQGVDPGRHDRVREAATEAYPGAGVTSSAGWQQPEDDDGAAAAACSLNGGERSSSNQRRLPRSRSRYRQQSSGGERQQQPRGGASGGGGERHRHGGAGVHHRERRAAGAPVPAQGRAPAPGHAGVAPGAPAGDHLRPGLLSWRRATCKAACKG